MQIPNPPPMNRFNIPIYRKFQEHFMDKIIEYTVLKDKLAIRTNQILIETNLKIEKLCKNERIFIDQFFKITANNEVYFKKGVEDEIGINAIKNYYKCCDDKLSFFEKDYKDFDNEFKKMETEFDIIKDQCYTEFIYVDEDIFIQCLGSLLYKKLDKIIEFSSSEKTLNFFEYNNLNLEDLSTKFSKFI